MRKLIFAVLLFCIIAVKLTNAQQHNKGFWGIAVNGGLILNDEVGKSLAVKYFRFLNGDFTIGGKLLFMETYKRFPEIGKHPIHHYFAIIAGDYTFLKRSPFYLSLSLDLGGGYENMRGLEEKLKKNYLEVSKGEKSSFGLIFAPKIEGEYFLGTLAISAEVGMMYFPFSNGEVIAPIMGIGIKQIF
ncbi:hypothetical protein [Porphyromonas gingivicanis]|uniref:hypothetical protein n=1 Tax=Porphyromonas gingivicanis TaxID=266762 RepID=UPI00046ED1FD|nr:hypothetical protein [Porphyromonas gingivicanis]